MIEHAYKSFDIYNYAGLSIYNAKQIDVCPSVCLSEAKYIGYH